MTLLYISEVKNRYDKSPKMVSIDWERFCQKLENPDRSRGKLSFQDYHNLNPNNPYDKEKRANEKDGMGFVPGILSEGKGRKNDAVSEITALVLDFDNGNLDLNSIKEKLGQYEFFAHTTYSHSPEKPKFRAIIPFFKGTSPKNLSGIFDYFNHLLLGNLDPCGKKPSQLYYYPSCPPDAPFRAFRNLGKVFNPLDIEPSETDLTIPQGTSPNQPRGIIGEKIPKPCDDGERHKVFLPFIGRCLKLGYSKEKILNLSRKWNLKNKEQWPDEVLILKIEGVCKSDKCNNPERYKPKPWEGIDIPYGYELSIDGVFCLSRNKEKGDFHFCSPCWVSAKSRDLDGNSWGMVVEWIDSDHKLRKQAIPKERLHEGGNKLAQYLASCGLDIIPGKEKYLLNYLGQFSPQKRLTCVSKLGWVETPNNFPTFLLPLQNISNNSQVEFVYQPESYSLSTSTIIPKGSLLDWQTKVALLAKDHPFLIFSLCVAFGGPLLKLVGLEGGGFHIFGRSSHGKTTAAQLAASVWGCGADPAEAPSKAYVRKWNTTHNGLEGLAASHNDLILILDEAGTCNAKDFGKIIYDLTGGQGKVAMNSERALRQPRAWHLLILSTGEISSKQKIEEEGKIARSGQVLRMIDIPIEEGVFNSMGRRTGASLALEIKNNCASFFGTAGPAFLEKLIKEFLEFPELRREVRNYYEKALSNISIPELLPEQNRALQRLALVLAAGEIARKLDILPFEKDEIEDSIKSIRDIWLKDQDNISEGFHGINAIREFILKNPGRFGDATGNNKEARLVEIVGYRNTQEELYLFTQDGLKEACKGNNIKEVLSG